MNANGLERDVAADVAAFLLRHLPRGIDRPGYYHQFASAYQMGCEALAALGYAEETGWGATPIEPPRLPESLPRRDDICVAVLGLAYQQGLLKYHRTGDYNPATGEGRIASRECFRVHGATGAATPLQPNIAAIDGLGPAFAKQEMLPLLSALGLVAERCWTRSSETVLWREHPREWQIEFTGDQRFRDAVERACATVPDDVRVEMGRLSSITEGKVAKFVARSAKTHSGKQSKYPKPSFSPPTATERARMSLEFNRRYELDWLFFRRWRLSDGWLSPTEMRRALQIFHDPLAIEMRRAVMSRLYPDLAFLASR